MSKDREKKRRPILKIVLLILTTISLISSAFAIYEILSLQSIENLIRYIVVGVLVLIDLIIVLKTKSICKKRPKNKHSKRVGYVIFMVIYTLICAFVGIVIFYLYGKLSNMNKSQILYSSSVVAVSYTHLTLPTKA